MKTAMPSLLVVFFVMGAVAGEFQLSNVSASIGKGALTSGYDVTLVFAREGNSFQVTGNHTRVYGMYRWIFPGITVAASGGFFKNAPWAGPMVQFSPWPFLKTVHWYGVVAGVPEHPAWKPNLMIRYNAIAANYAGFAATYAISKFMEDPADQLPGVSYTSELNGSWTYTLAMDVSVNNKEPLFQFGLKKIF